MSGEATPGALLACPLCGGSDVENMGDFDGNRRPQVTWFVTCDDCGCRTTLFTDEQAATAAWNTRAPDPRDTASPSEVKSTVIEGTTPGAAHTPGPWEVMRLPYGYRVFSPAGDAELGNWHVAEVRWEDDAVLIASAPYFAAEIARLKADPRDATIADLRAEVADLQGAFDLRWAAQARARERWRSAHPGNDLVWPDHADLVVWLMDWHDFAVVEIERLRALTQTEWSDKPLPEDAEIAAAHPLRSKDPNANARYAEAMRLVGARHSKYGLVELVGWLLARAALSPNPGARPTA